MGHKGRYAPYFNPDLESGRIASRQSPGGPPCCNDRKGEQRKSAAAPQFRRVSDPAIRKQAGVSLRACLHLFFKRLVLELRREELPVQTGDVRNRNHLRTLGLASSRIGTVTEAQFVHLGHHRLARRAPSTRPCGSFASDDTRAATKSIAEPFLQVAAQAPQPMQAAASIATSASAFGMGMLLASCTAFVRTEMKPPA